MYKVLSLEFWVLRFKFWILSISEKSQISNLKSQICFIVFIFFLLSSDLTNAQCAMCRAALESEEGLVKAEAVNDGIVYLMAIPYVLVGFLGYVIYRSRKKNKK